MLHGSTLRARGCCAIRRVRKWRGCSTAIMSSRAKWSALRGSATYSGAHRLEVAEGLEALAEGSRIAWYLPTPMSYCIGAVVPRAGRRTRDFRSSNGGSGWHDSIAFRPRPRDAAFRYRHPCGGATAWHAVSRYPVSRCPPAASI
ncbi:hypothetical protein DSL92_02035 [Billgrantia gudaonensis]|uniref:Uncharacterized protein n=1 Tax=Billgrantia gudaonensis TaxID=376427 RepID=A0A432JKD1_9GAMM|nr:hypothetical protein DSL92_02035 [Halomonas gudaonensis]